MQSKAICNTSIPVPKCSITSHDRNSLQYGHTLTVLVSYKVLFMPLVSFFHGLRSIRYWRRSSMPQLCKLQYEIQISLVYGTFAAPIRDAICVVLATKQSDLYKICYRLCLLSL